MAYSTGRGGAGNIHESPNLTSENNKATIERSNKDADVKHDEDDASGKEKKVFYSTGRGGAGNIQASSKAPSPKLVPQGSNTPSLQTSKVTTGRGGYGNMVSNDDPKLTRKLQDVDGPADPSKEEELHTVKSNKSFSVGRGGYGNVITHSTSETNNPNEPNLYAITSHGNKKSDKKGQGIFSKIKSIFN